jgi:hypothetical protein
MSTVLPLGRRRALACALLALGAVALLGAALIGYRRLQHVRAAPPPVPGQADVSRIERWMTVRYVAHVYHVPEPELYRALGADPDRARDLSLEDVAAELGQPPEAVLATVRASVSRHLSGRSPPAAGPTP